MYKRNVFGLSDNLTGVLCYAFAYISGFFFLMFEKENKLVRFHALQSTVWFLLLTAVMLIWRSLFGGLLLIGPLVSSALSLAGVLSWAYLMYAALVGKVAKLPYIGEAAWNQVYR